MKCHIPNCNKEIPKWRAKKKRITCSKICSSTWNHLSSVFREKIRGKNMEKQINSGEKYLGKLDIESPEAKQRIGKGPNPTHISLFTGIGGFDLGFANAGIKTRAMVEWDKGCCATLRANWHWEELKKRTYGHWENPDGKVHRGDMYTGNKTKAGVKLKYVVDKLKWESKEKFLEEATKYNEALKKRKKPSYQFAMSAPPATWYHKREPVIIEKDITKTTTKEILEAAELQVGECSIISGGFPCQGFSLAGRRVRDDPRNFLYKEFVRVIDEAKPAMFIGENVPGIVSLGKGEVIQQICEDFANCGYDVYWDILNAADYGVPQNRKRVILIGKRIDLLKFNGENRPSFHIGAVPGEIRHPYLFYERIKRWKRKEFLKQLEKNPQVKFLKKKEIENEKENN